MAWLQIFLTRKAEYSQSSQQLIRDYEADKVKANVHTCEKSMAQKYAWQERMSMIAEKDSMCR